MSSNGGRWIVADEWMARTTAELPATFADSAAQFITGVAPGLYRQCGSLAGAAPPQMRRQLSPDSGQQRMRGAFRAEDRV